MENKPEDICVNFETAKRMHEAGIVVNSLYVWYRGKTRTVWGANLSTPNWSLSYLGAYTFAESSRLSPNCEMYLAPTAEEILPIYIESIKKSLWNKDHMMYIVEFGNLIAKCADGAKLCEAFADAVMKLKEAGYGIDGNKG